MRQPFQSFLSKESRTTGDSNSSIFDIYNRHFFSKCNINFSHCVCFLHGFQYSYECQSFYFVAIHEP